ncbi:hypothetical protein K469DRAFT_698877 [Zopfia rhizophila CBS 207.26]|uniref:Uncharacterized protein n=1 Tax=Zopfia rhizophila CBS 207.26 TaxID=1314779 RepID=A0A6A6EWC5_9PEZI|nr:hypothetical protein K469DRAFT_698877 [Zopfia rhizophila CBS 207.26]
MPIVPYHHGGGQVPLQGFVPSLSRPPSISSALLPTYPPAAVDPTRTLDESPTVAPAASQADTRPTIDIPTEHHSHEPPSRKAPTSSFVAVAGCNNGSEIQMKGRKPAFAALGTFLGLFTYSEIYQKVLFSKITPISEQLEESSWLASSHSWLDRKICTWFGFCGLTHLDKAGWTTKRLKGGRRKQQKPLSGDRKEPDRMDLKSFWTNAATNPDDWSDEERVLREIPEYIKEYAPLIHLYSGEEFWPCDIADHLIHTTPHLNYTPLQASSDHPNLTNLDDLNKWGRFVYLQSDDNVEERPDWLGGETNIPDQPEDSDGENRWEGWGDWVDWVDKGLPEEVNDEEQRWRDAGIGDTVDKGGIRPVSTTSTGSVTKPTVTPEGEEHVDNNWQPELVRRKLGKRVLGGKSDAPAVLIAVDKGNGVVDAFWFFFYSYNLGNTVFNVRFGNHVGDWEHTAIRFHHGKPKAVYFSEHSFGEAYSYDALEKIGKRPVGYSATGTHAMYAAPGTHPYILPGGILHDVTDRGPLWDPLLNVHSFTYDYVNDTLRSSNLTPRAPIGWFYFMGHWGDKFYPLSDPRQYRFLGQYHYVNGPLGPRFKNLGRKHICGGDEECHIKNSIGSRRARRMKRYPEVGEGEEMNEQEVRRFVGPKDGSK